MWAGMHPWANRLLNGVGELAVWRLTNKQTTKKLPGTSLPKYQETWRPMEWCSPLGYCVRHLVWNFGSRDYFGQVTLVAGTNLPEEKVSPFSELSSNSNSEEIFQVMSKY